MSLIFLSVNICASVSPIGFGFTHKGELGQFPSEKSSVYGLRTNFFGIKNKKMVGIDFGGLNISEDLYALMQIGVVNITEKRANIFPLQVGLANYHKGTSKILGMQLGLLGNYNKKDAHIIGYQIGVLGNFGRNHVYGVQMGVYNRATRIVGLQVGIVNLCDNLHGIQLGLLNVCKSCLFSMTPGINIGL